MRRIGVAMILITGMFASVPPADAAFPDTRTYPGGSGRIAFERLSNTHWLIFSILPNGTGPLNLTTRDMNNYTPAWSADGTKIVFRRRKVPGGTGSEGIWIMKSNGDAATKVPNTNWAAGYPSLSPDGTMIAYSNESDGRVYTIKTDGTSKTPLTGTAGNATPVWSPDGTEIAFVSHRDGDNEIFVMNADGTGETRVTSNSVPDDYPDWSPDGTQLVFQRTRASGDEEIYRMGADGSGITRITNHLGDDLMPVWSPNAAKIAFVCNDGDAEICTMNSDGTVRQQVTANTLDDYFPDWEPA